MTARPLPVSACPTSPAASRPGEGHVPPDPPPPARHDRPPDRRAARRQRRPEAPPLHDDAGLDAYIRQVIDGLPPLTGEQRDRLALILGSGRAARPGAAARQPRAKSAARPQPYPARPERRQPGDAEGDTP